MVQEGLLVADGAVEDAGEVLAAVIVEAEVQVHLGAHVGDEEGVPAAGRFLTQHHQIVGPVLVQGGLGAADLVDVDHPVDVRREDGCVPFRVDEPPAGDFVPKVMGAAQALLLAVQGDENNGMGVGLAQFLHVLEHPGQCEEGGDAGSVAVRPGIQVPAERADVVEMGGDDHVLVPASGEEAHDVVGGGAGQCTEAAEPGAVGRQEAAGGELAGDAGLRMDGTRRSGGTAGADAVGEELHPGPEACFVGQGLGVARADEDTCGLGPGECRRGEQEQAGMQKFSGHPSEGHDKCLSL